MRASRSNAACSRSSAPSRVPASATAARINWSPRSATRRSRPARRRSSDTIIHPSLGNVISPAKDARAPDKVPLNSLPASTASPALHRMPLDGPGRRFIALRRARHYPDLSCRYPRSADPALRADRLLGQAQASGGDPLQPTALFGISDGAAIRYCAQAGPLGQATSPAASASQPDPAPILGQDTTRHGPAVPASKGSTPCGSPSSPTCTPTRRRCGRPWPTSTPPHRTPSCPAVTWRPGRFPIRPSTCCAAWTSPFTACAATPTAR